MNSFLPKYRHSAEMSALLNLCPALNQLQAIDSVNGRSNALTAMSWSSEILSQFIGIIQRLDMYAREPFRLRARAQGQKEKGSVSGLEWKPKGEFFHAAGQAELEPEST